MDRAFKGIWFTPVALFLITASVFITYSNAFHVPFQFDDVGSIAENRGLRSLKTAAAHIYERRGVTDFTFALNYAFGGLNVAGYHAVNILIHALAAIAAYFFVLQTLKLADDAEEDRYARKIAFFSSLLFALHPIQTQAVTYIVQRQESLASLFYLIAFLFFIAGARRKTGGGRTALYACTAASYALAFHSKEMAFTLPAAIFLYDLYFAAKGRIKALRERWPLYLVLTLLMAIFLVRTVAPIATEAAPSKAEIAGPVTAAGGAQALSDNAEKIEIQIPGINPLKRIPSAGFGATNISPKEYLYTQFNVIVYYLSLLAVPVNQNIDYDFPISKDLFSAPEKNPGAVINIPLPPPIVSLAILAAIIILAAFLFFRHVPAGINRVSAKKTNASMLTISFFIIWFFVLISPTSSFIPIADVIYEHRIYLASLGPFVIFVILIVRLFEWLTRKIVRTNGA